MIDAQTRDATRAATAVLFAFAFSAVFFSGLFPPFSNPNELSRLEAVVAAVDHGTFAIDEVIPRLGDHEDKAVSGDRTYSNKAPGLAFAAVPFYALYRLALPEPGSPAAPVFPWLRVLTVTAAAILALVRLRRRLGLQIEPAAVALLFCAAALGTPYLFYARSFFAHAWTAALLYLAWDGLMTSDEPGRRRGGWLGLVAGLLAGWAAISEYTVAPLAVLLALRSAAGGSWRRLAAFAAGLALPLALLAAYNAACFGSPWILSSAREAYPAYGDLASKGLFGFGAPSLAVALRYLVSPERGVLLFSPFLLWCVPGFFRWWRSGRGRADCLLAAAATLGFFVVMTGYPNWHGGWSLGSRYLLPILFFPIVAAGHALATPLSRGLFAAAVVFSVASQFLLSSTFPHFPDNVPWPAATGSAWFLARGWTAPTLAGISGIAGLLLPAAAFLAALALSIRASGPLAPRASVAALLGAAPLVLLLLRPPELVYGARLWRAAMFGAYSGRDPAREELKAVALEAATDGQRRQALGAWRIYGPPPEPAP